MIGRTLLRHEENLGTVSITLRRHRPVLFSITTLIFLFLHQPRLGDLRLGPFPLREARLATAIRGRDSVIEPVPLVHLEGVDGHQAVMCSCPWLKVSAQEAFGQLSADRWLEEGFLGRELLGGCRYRMNALCQHVQELGVAVRLEAVALTEIQNGEVTVMGFLHSGQASIGNLCSKGYG